MQIPTGKPEIRKGLIDECAQLTFNDRQLTYGDFNKNMELQSQITELLLANGLDRYSSTHNTCIHYVVGKLARMATGVLHRDNYADAANYLFAAFEAETLKQERKQSVILFDPFNSTINKGVSDHENRAALDDLYGTVDNVSVKEYE